MSASPVDAAAVPLSAYVHFPWCVAKCPYCDFNSHALRDTLPQTDYVDALLDDLDHELECRPQTRPLHSVFLGGGTPSLFEPASIARVLEALERRLGFCEDIEITMEANPGAVDAAHFAGYRAAGVNRLSLGVQSLDDGCLKAIGRIHDAAAAVAAVRTARRAGFDNLNLDLMFALPGQDLAMAASDLARALALEPEHLSYYHLTIEPNTAFARQPPPLPDEDLAADMLDQAAERLGAAGFERYEVSAWSRPGRRCAHNLNYWQFGDYLGIGAGAHGKCSGAHGIVRIARHRHPTRYLGGRGQARCQSFESVADADRVFEYLMNRLRLPGASPLWHFEQRTGLRAGALRAALAPLAADGLIHIDEHGFGVTELGFAHLNVVLQRLI